MENRLSGKKGCDRKGGEKLGNNKGCSQDRLQP